MRALLELFHARRRKLHVPDDLRTLHGGPGRNRRPSLRRTRGEVLMRDATGLPRASSASGTRWLWLALAAVAADRFTKHLIETRTTDSFNYSVISDVVTLVHSRNPGIAFGMFSDSPPQWLKVLLIVGAFAVILFLAALLVANRVSGAPAHAGLALIIGGAAGNTYDRLVHGFVTRFFLRAPRLVPLARIQRRRFRHLHRRSPDPNPTVFRRSPLPLRASRPLNAMWRNTRNDPTTAPGVSFVGAELVSAHSCLWSRATAPRAHLVSD